MAQDHDLQQAVLAELAGQPSELTAPLGVAEAGAVTQIGHVKTYSQKMAAEQASLRVRGVKAYSEEIELRLPFDLQRRDDDIAAAAIERLAWSAGVLTDRFPVKVEQDWVTLSGVANCSCQKEAGCTSATSWAVVRHFNQITVKPRVETSSIGDDIDHALHRSWFFDASDLHVSAVGGRVLFSRTACSQHDRECAAATAWVAPSATDTINDMLVG